MTSKHSISNYLKKTPKPFNSVIENGDKEDYFVYSNLEKPETLSPMEMELRIQADRVMFSLNKVISVLSVMTHLPYLMENDAKILRDNFTTTEVAFILYVLHSYNSSTANVPKEKCVEGISEIYDTINKIKLSKSAYRMSDEFTTDPNLLQVVNMLFTNKCIRDEIRKSPNPVTVPFINDFIRNFDELKLMAEHKLYVTGTEEEARDRQLRQAYKSNVMLTAAITDLEQQLKTQREQLGNELNKKVEIFEKYNKKIENIKEEFQISIEKNIHETERKMMQQCLESEAKQSALSTQAEAITNQYERLLDDHLDEEKRLRAKTAKTQTQLHNWLTKYDQDIGEKQAEYETLKEQYDQEKAAMDELEDKMDEQNRVYNTLMAEKEEEEERLFQEIAYKMLINRSARVIQRAWRSYRERKAKKRSKKGKKGKNGKKSQDKK